MAPRQSLSGLVVIALASSCAAFLPGPTSRTVGNFGSPVRAASPSSAPRLRNSEGPSSRATRLSVSTNAKNADAASRGSTFRLGGSRAQTAAGALQAVSGGAGEEQEGGGGGGDVSVARRALLLAIWLPFTVYAFGPWSPGATGDPKDLELVMHLYDPDTAQNAIFFGIFNFLGFVPAIMASMLVGGGAFGKGRQPVPPQPFVFGAFALGFFSVGPYLALRNYLPERDEGEEMSTLEKALTSKPLALLLSALAVLTMVPLLSALADPGTVSGFTELFWSSKLVHISTLDLIVLSAVIIDPIREDMRRRGVDPEPARVALHAVPVVGPALWMVVRPPVEI